MTENGLSLTFYKIENIFLTREKYQQRHLLPQVASPIRILPVYTFNSSQTKMLMTEPLLTGLQGLVIRTKISEASLQIIGIVLPMTHQVSFASLALEGVMSQSLRTVSPLLCCD